VRYIAHKDDIKEILFDSLGWHDREWSKRAGKTTCALMDYVIEGQLKAGHSIIIESPYDPVFQNENSNDGNTSTISMQYRSSAMQTALYYSIVSYREVILQQGIPATSMQIM
jgi:hypothetical protein